MYAKEGNLKAGSLIRVDGGFTCIEENATRVVKDDGTGDLYFDCSEGGHAIIGQLENGEYIGVHSARE